MCAEAQGAAMMEGMEGMGMMGSWMMIGWLIILLVVVGAAFAGGMWLGGSLAKRAKDAPQLEADPAQIELRRRYVAGEIDREEYLQRKIDIEEQ